MKSNKNIKAEIYNFRGVKEANIDLSRIALLTGKNYSGKTSVARAIASAITTEEVFDGLKKAQKGELVNRSAKTSLVKVYTDEGDITQKFPEGKITTSKRPNLYMSLYAAGIKSILDKDVDDKERSKFFIELLNANPTKDDLKDVLNSEMINAEILDELWMQISQEGWDGVYDEYTSQAKEKKGAWKEVTHETYGKVKALSWTPDESVNFELFNEEDVKAKLSDLQTQYENTIAQSALNDYKINELNQKISNEENCVNSLKELEVEQKVLTENLAKLNELKSDEVLIYECPECKTKLELQKDGESNKLIKSKVTKKQSGPSNKISNLNSEIEGANARVTETNILITKIKAEIASIKNAKIELKEIDSKSNSANPENPEEIQTEIEALRQSLINYERFTRAFEIHNEIEEDLQIAEILSPTGLRKEKLKSNLIKFNEEVLAPLTKDFDIEKITIDEDMNVYLGNGIYYIKDPDYALSKCEQFMVRTVLQIAIAKLDGSDLIIIDNADELNSPDDRSSLFNMVINAKLSTLICMAMQPEQKMPNLESIGVGITYNVSNGMVNKIDSNTQPMIKKDNIA